MCIKRFTRLVGGAAFVAAVLAVGFAGCGKDSNPSGGGGGGGGGSGGGVCLVKNGGLNSMCISNMTEQYCKGTEYDDPNTTYEHRSSCPGGHICVGEISGHKYYYYVEATCQILGL